MTPSLPPIQLRTTDTKGAFFIAEAGDESAVLTFSKAGNDLLILDHTQVDDRWRGQGVGQLLVAQAVAHARAHGLRLMPLCPFAKAAFDKNPDWQDVRHG